MGNVSNASICSANSTDSNAAIADEYPQQGRSVFQQEGAEHYRKQRLAEFAASSALAVCCSLLLTWCAQCTLVIINHEMPEG